MNRARYATMAARKSSNSEREETMVLQTTARNSASANPDVVATGVVAVIMAAIASINLGIALLDNASISQERVCTRL